MGLASSSQYCRPWCPVESNRFRHWVLLPLIHPELATFCSIIIPSSHITEARYALNAVSWGPLHHQYNQYYETRVWWPVLWSSAVWCQKMSSNVLLLMFQSGPVWTLPLYHPHLQASLWMSIFSQSHRVQGSPPWRNQGWSDVMLRPCPSTWSWWVFRCHSGP